MGFWKMAEANEKTFWSRIAADAQLYIGLALIIGFSIFSVHSATNAANKANAKASAAQNSATAAQQYADNVNKALCKYSVPSWEARVALIHDVNKPTQLASAIDPQSEIGLELQAQITQSNADKAIREKAELLQNGPKPCQ